jgi:hypothetical protein
MLRPEKSRAEKNGYGHLLYLGILTIFAFALYWEAFVYDSFGPETALYYYYSDGVSLALALRSFIYVQLMWYRPMVSILYWAGEQFAGWHNILGWKLLHFITVLWALYALYWLVVACLGGTKMAGLLSAAWFAAQPNVYPGVMEAAGFDFVHIAFTILCAGLYLRATEASGRRMVWLTSLAWLCFLIALASKEVALAVPFYLAALSALAVLDSPRYGSWRREAFRLAPFFAILPLYYLLHFTKVPAGSFPGTGPYRSVANWGMILANLRKMSLWIMRIYAWSGETLGERMYQSNAVNHLAGVASAALIALMWWRKSRWKSGGRLLAILLSWIVVFLALPVYAGGFLWHINLPLVGYSVLFGTAAAWAWAAIPSRVWRGLAPGFFLAGLLALGRYDLHTELYSGTHALAFRINHSVLKNPPVPADHLGKSPLVYIEDRLGVGGWWYGCYGILFNYTYLRHDIQEVVVPRLAAVPQDLRARWLAHPNAFLFRLDENFDWRDATSEFRSAPLTGTSAPNHL